MASQRWRNTLAVRLSGIDLENLKHLTEARHTVLACL